MGGRIGALVVLSDTTEDVAKDVAMHVAAMNPTAVTRSEVPQDIVEHESKNKLCKKENQLILLRRWLLVD